MKQLLENIAKNKPEKIVQLYLFLMLGVFPLYYQNKYYNMGEAKYLFFRAATFGMSALLICALIWDETTEKDGKEKRMDVQWKWKLPQLSSLDRAVLIYITAVAFSWLCSPYRENLWIGSFDWYMGLLSQLLFAVAYFAVSRFGSFPKGIFWGMEIGGMAAFLVAYLHRFSIDPLGFYDKIPDTYRLEFLGTVGQATWYSSYLAIVLPLAMGIYLFSGKRKMGFFLFLGFASAFTQNSDSIYIGLGAAFLFLLWFAFEKKETGKRYLEICLTAILAARITGSLQMLFPDRVPQLDTLSLTITKGWLGFLPLPVLLVIYGVLCRSDRKAADGEIGAGNGAKDILMRIRLAFFLLIALAGCLLPVMMWLATTGRLSAGDGILGQSGYLVFDESWGRQRGWIWSYALRIFSEYPPFAKLFGYGPDSMTFYSAAHHAQELRKLWGSSELTNAHNEWLTALINNGIVGAGAYYAVFATALLRICRHIRRQPLLAAAGAAVLSYIGHNFFCYQQVVCTSLIFLVIGAGECLIRAERLVETHEEAFDTCRETRRDARRGV